MKANTPLPRHDLQQPISTFNFDQEVGRQKIPSPPRESHNAEANWQKTGWGIALSDANLMDDMSEEQSLDDDREDNVSVAELTEGQWEPMSLRFKRTARMLLGLPWKK